MNRPYGLIAAVLGILLCAVLSTAQETPGHREMQLREDVSVRELTDGVWLHTTYFDVAKFGRVAANGLIIKDGDNAVFVNVPWTDEQTGVLFDWIAREHHATVRTVVPTHSHADCSGGLGEAHRRGADSLALAATADLLKKAKNPVPHQTFRNKAVVKCGRIRIEMAYVGPGHTVDNIVAWIPSKRILFAGCLVKEQSAIGLGNAEDADLAQYAKTLRKLKGAYPDAVAIVPGHGELGGLELIDHTLALCAKAR